MDAAKVYRDLSIVIPLAPSEQSWQQLLVDLKPLAKTAEVILVYPETEVEHLKSSGVFVAYADFRWLPAPQGRATQLNAGAAASSRSVLWFLHADSRIDKSTIKALRRVLAASLGDRVYYFTLRFLPDGPRLMPVNELGAWFRSRFLRMPFGDQGLLMRKTVFFDAGSFPTGLAYGEDHCFIWQAARAGYPCQPTGGSLWTSARKYREQGWLRTTLRHQSLTFKQAVPEWWKSWRHRMPKASH